MIFGLSCAMWSGSRGCSGDGVAAVALDSGSGAVVGDCGSHGGGCCCGVG